MLLVLINIVNLKLYVPWFAVGWRLGAGSIAVAVALVVVVEVVVVVVVVVKQ